jgi:hypothetical protein
VAAETKTARKKARAALCTTLTRVFPFLSAKMKAQLRVTALNHLVETLDAVVRRENAAVEGEKLEKLSFPKLQKAQFVRAADEDAFFLDSDVRRVHFIVSGDGDAFMANLQCVNDKQVVVQVAFSEGEVLVRNARDVKAAIFREHFPDLVTG